MSEVTAPRALSARELLADVKIVDADTHITEWHDLWISRAPASMKDRVPQVRMKDGRALWMIDGDKDLGAWGSGASAVRKDGSKALGISFADLEIGEIHPASYNVHDRVAYMDQEGIAAQIAYPNLLGFGGKKSMMVDPELRLLSTQIYNDAMAEMQAQSNQRIYPMALMPWWDVKASVIEVERCHAMGLRGVNMNPDAQNHGVPHLGEDYWEPLWEVCSDKGLPINFHIGASDSSMSWYGEGLWSGHNEDTQLAYGSLMLFIGNLRVLANIFLSQFLERWPKLKIVSVESGAGWAPFLLEGLEYQMAEAGMKVKVSPTEIFKRQIYITSWFERRHLVDTVRQIGEDNLMFETDFPHPTCLYPDTIEYVADAAKEMTPQERAKVFGGNAERVYNLDLSHYVK